VLPLPVVVILLLVRMLLELVLTVIPMPALVMVLLIMLLELEVVKILMAESLDSVLLMMLLTTVLKTARSIETPLPPNPVLRMLLLEMVLPEQKIAKLQEISMALEFDPVTIILLLVMLLFV